jgi:hypothetical protein
LNPERRAQLAAIAGLYLENAARFRESMQFVKGAPIDVS